MLKPNLHLKLSWGKTTFIEISQHYFETTNNKDSRGSHTDFGMGGDQSKIKGNKIISVNL